MTRANSDELLRVLLRLLIDEIVDDLSQSGSGCESRSVQEPSPGWTPSSDWVEFAGTFRPKRNHKLVVISR